MCLFSAVVHCMVFVCLSCAYSCIYKVWCACLVIACFFVCCVTCSFVLVFVNNMFVCGCLFFCLSVLCCLSVFSFCDYACLQHVCCVCLVLYCLDVCVCFVGLCVRGVPMIVDNTVGVFAWCCLCCAYHC